MDPQPTTGATTQMAREIAEQPEAVRRTLDALLPLRPRVAELYGGRRRVLLVARGSSDNAAVYARYLLETHAGVNAGLAAPSVATHYRSRLDLSDALVVSVSQSGATEEIVATQRWAAGCGAATVAVTNVEGSPLAAEADLALVTRAGPELAVPATKTYLTQLAALAVLATALAPDPNALDGHLARVPDEVAALLSDDLPLGEAVELVAAADLVVAAGRGLLLGTALEAALKLEETTLRVARGYSYADLRHGPISVVESGVAAVLVAAADGPLVQAMTGLATDLAARGAQTVGIGGDAAFAEACTRHLRGPDLPEQLAPLAAVVPVQRLVEQVTARLGLDPDNPRGLAKVTQTDSHS
jgi:glutamine---fructose-6-phosphate transaminase (isomerizing)